MNETMTDAKAVFEHDEGIHGCGYWSLCIEHDCPCSPGSPVSRGFDEKVWERMRDQMIEDIADEYGPQYEVVDDHSHIWDDDEE